MPKLERLSWIAPLSEGRGVTLSNDPAADELLAEDPFALMIGVLLDSQMATRKAFTSPLQLYERLGYIDPKRIASYDEDALVQVFQTKPALHRFPRKFAVLTRRLAEAIVSNYDGDASRIWREAKDVDDLGQRVAALPSFGVEKTNWTVGMLGTLGILPFADWEEYRVPAAKRKTQAPGLEKAQ